MSATKTSLIAAAEAAARSIEEAAAEEGTVYAAEQLFYGVEAEALVGEEWVELGNLGTAGAEVRAVRLYDCDGERGWTCRTVEQVEAERVRWIEMLESATHEDDDAD